MIGEYELKFHGSSYRAPQLLKYLCDTLQADGEYSSSSISSIYFDSKDFKSLAEKLNSDYLKSKYRVRWYGDVESQKTYKPTYLETKYKIGSQRVKSRIRLPEDVAALFQKCELKDFAMPKITQLLASQGIPLRQQVFPVFVINYKRYRFVDPVSESRISVDMDICVPKINSAVIPRALPMPLDSAVVEVKGKLGRLPENLCSIVDLGFRKRAFSKYSVCYEKIVHLNSGIN
jgi:hypothetical protein